MKQQIEQAIQTVIHDRFDQAVEVELTRPDESFGDFATNVAMQLAKPLGRSPRDIATEIVEALQTDAPDWLDSVTIAGPGFLNIIVSQATLLAGIEDIQPTQTYTGQTVVAEYSDPNPFKVLHAGHFYTSVVGDAIANLVAAAGATVHRVNFGGDVGMHVGKTMWALLQELGGEHPEKLAAIPAETRSEWLATAYVKGSNLFDTDDAIKAEMVSLNKQIYAIHAADDHKSPLAQIYWTCRQWSYEYFDAFYAQIGSNFEKYYPESQTAETGLQAVRQHIGDVFQESDGAVVFVGEPYGLHTRVFINSQGIPTYETKDVGLIIKKYEDYHFDQSIVITGNEQTQYMQVVLKAIEQFAPELSNATQHRTHGLVKLAGNVKMSSRKGNILRAVDVLSVAQEANLASTGKDDPAVVLGAIKYAFLKNRLGGDIIYDPAESVALEGNSGPYLQYALVRARSLQRRATVEMIKPTHLDPAERSLARKISEFPEISDKAIAELMPHHIGSYLYELAQSFNRFYEQSRVLDDPRSQQRLYLVDAYAKTLQTGLQYLGMPTPDQM